MVQSTLTAHEKEILLTWIEARNPGEATLARELPDETLLSLYSPLMPAGDDFKLLVALHGRISYDNVTRPGAEYFMDIAKQFESLPYVRREEPMKHYFESIVYETVANYGYTTIQIAPPAYEFYRDRTGVSVVHRFYGTISSALMYHDVDDETLNRIRDFVRSYAKY